MASYIKISWLLKHLKAAAIDDHSFVQVFILVDKPNEELDAMLSDHIMNLHSKQPKSTSFMSSSLASSQSSLASLNLKDRLKRLPEEELDLVPHELLRKYIAYARQVIFRSLK